MEESVIALKKELQVLLDAHSCTVTPTMELKRDAQFEAFEKIVRQKRNTYSVFDLNAGRYVFHYSAHCRWFDSPVIEVHQPENRENLYALTHPDDIRDVLKTELKGYTDLQALPREETSGFSFQYLSRLRGRGNEYQLYLHKVTVLSCDAERRPWLMVIITERLPECCCNKKCMADIYDLIPSLQHVNPTKKGIDINHSHLSELDLHILQMVYDGYKLNVIATANFKSIHTIRGHYNDILRKLGVGSIHLASVYAHIIGLMMQMLFVVLCWSTEVGEQMLMSLV